MDHVPKGRKCPFIKKVEKLEKTPRCEAEGETVRREVGRGEGEKVSPSRVNEHAQMRGEIWEFKT